MKDADEYDKLWRSGAFEADISKQTLPNSNPVPSPTQPASSSGFSRREAIFGFGAVIVVGGLAILAASVSDESKRNAQPKPVEKPKPTEAPKPAISPSPVANARPTEIPKPVSPHQPSTKPTEIPRFTPAPKTQPKETSPPSPNKIVLDREIPEREMIARDIFGSDFLGPEAIIQTFGSGIQNEAIPPIRFSQFELERAKDLEQFLILRTSHLKDRPLTMEEMELILKKQLTSDPNKINVREEFYKKDTAIPRWALVTKAIIPGSQSVNYLKQTEILADYVRNRFYTPETTPAEINNAIRQFESEKGSIAQVVDQRAGNMAYAPGEHDTKLANLIINQSFRQQPVELFYDLLVYFFNTNTRLLRNEFTWSNRQTSSGLLVNLGGFGEGGVYIKYDTVSRVMQNVGVVFSTFK